MLIAAVVKPSSSSASYTVTASRARCSRFMLMIASRIERAMPAARRAAKDGPDSTTRARSRSYQTRCGMWCTSACAPVASEERHTGVSDGNVDTARAYSPCSARNDSAGARPSATAASNTDGVSPSMTMRIAFFITAPSVAGKRAQSGVALGCAAAQARGEGGDERRLEVAGNRDPGHRREHERGEPDEDRDAEARAPAPHRPAHELRSADRAEHAAHTAADRLVPLPEPVPDRNADAGCEHERPGQREARAGEQRREQDADSDTEACANADPVPGAHPRSV